MNRKIKTVVTIPAAILVLIAGWFSLFARRTPAQTTELHAMISDGMKTVVEELTPQIEYSIGRKLAPQFNSSKNLRDKILTGEPYDAARHARRHFPHRNGHGHSRRRRKARHQHHRIAAADFDECKIHQL